MKIREYLRRMKKSLANGIGFDIIYGPSQRGRFLREYYLFNNRRVSNHLIQVFLELFGCLLTLAAILTLPIWGPLDRILKILHRQGFVDVEGYRIYLCTSKAFQKIK